MENEEDAQKILTELKRLRITGKSLGVLRRFHAEGLLQIIEVSLKQVKLGFFSAAEGNSFRILWWNCSRRATSQFGSCQKCKFYGKSSYFTWQMSSVVINTGNELEDDDLLQLNCPTIVVWRSNRVTPRFFNSLLLVRFFSYFQLAYSILGMASRTENSRKDRNWYIHIQSK